MKWFRLFILVVFGIAGAAKAQHAKTPMMGWSSWNTFRVNISESLIRETADSMVAKGLKAAGYANVNIDDGYFGGRNADGTLKSHPVKFPNGMKSVADYIHGKGLKAGIYSEVGRNTCGSIYDSDTYGVGVGFYGHVEQDAQTFFDEWGYDYIKVDYCGAEQQGLDEKTSYTEIWNAIRQTAKAQAGAEIRFNVCRWMFPGTWVTQVGGSWRISHDIRNTFNETLGVRDVFEQNLYLAAYASPGHFNDMDMMQVGRGMSEDEEKSHFGLWCIMSSPLMIGCDLRTIPQSTLNIITNPEVIAVNQDTLGLQAQVVGRTGKCFVVAKPIETRNGKVRAVALFNGENSRQTLRITFKDVQLGGAVKVRNLWAKTDLGIYKDYYEVRVPPHGATMLRLEGASSFDKKRYQGEYAFMNAYTAIGSGGEHARVEVASGAVASGGYKMSKLGNSPDNWAEFRNVYVTKSGKYTFKLFYYSPENRNLQVLVNETPYAMSNLNSGSLHSRAEASIEIDLRQGDNVIRLENPTDWAPDVDKFELKPEEDDSEETDDFDVDEAGTFPKMSSDDDTEETWYHIRFKNGNGVIRDMGNNADLLTKKLDSDDSAQRWKVVEVANTSGDFRYKIVGQTGRVITHVSSPETSDGMFQATNSVSAAVRFAILPTENATYAPAWELHREGSSRHMNQYKGAGLDRRISEWNSNDQGNPLEFVAPANAEQVSAVMPEISNSQQEVWYYICFIDAKEGETAVLEDMGSGNPLMTKNALDGKPEQLWKVALSENPEGEYMYELVSKSGGKVAWNSSSERYVTGQAGVCLRLSELAPYWGVERTGASDGLGMTQTALGPESQVKDDYYSAEGRYSLLEFKLPEEMFLYLCSNASLESLAVAPGALSPDFHPDSLDYTVTLDYGVDSIMLSATAACAEAILTGDAGKKKALEVGKNLFSVAVTAEDDLSLKTYTVTVIRAAAATGVQAAAENRWMLYPNPITGGVLTIENGNLKAGEQVEVYSLAGNLVATFELTSGDQTVVNVSHLPKGTYIVKLGKRVAKAVVNY
jgi:hypothetical protein